MKLRPPPHLSSRPRGWRLALGAGMITLALAASAATDPRASRLYEDALQRFEEKDHAGAIVQLKNALQIDKNMLPVHVLLGKALLAQDDVGAAEVAFVEALRLGVNRTEVVIPLARAVLQQGKAKQLLQDAHFNDKGLPAAVRYELLVLKAGALDDTGDRKSALKLLAEARELDPKAAGAWITEVKIHLRGNQATDALAAADRALNLAPGQAEAIYTRGTVSHVQGDLKTALTFYDKALSASPKHAEALVSRAGLLMDLKRLPEAKRDVEALLKLEGKDPRGAYLSALIAEREGRSADAKAALGRVAAILDPAPVEMLRFRPQFLMLGGLSYFGLGQLEKAKPYLDLLLREQPASPVAKLMARIHLQEGNGDRAVETLEAYLRRQPGDPQATLLLASAHMAQGRHPRAVALLQEAATRDKRVEYHNALGLALMKSGQTRDALRELELAYRKDPKQIQSATALAALYLQQGQLAKGVAVAAQLNQDRPNQPGLLHLLGSAKAQAGDVKGARTAFEAAAKLDVKFIEPHVELARLELREGQVDAAQARLKRVVAAQPKHVGALMLMGQLFAGQGQRDQAQTWMEKADDHSGADNLDAAVWLVEYHLAHNQVDRATESLKRLTAKAPDAYRVLVARAKVELASSDKKAARVSLSRASSAAGFNPTMLARVADLQIAVGDLPGAAHAADKALKDSPTHLPSRVVAARVDVLRGDWSAAEQRAKQIVQDHPKSGVGHALLGDVALGRNQPAQAAAAFRRAHQIDNDSPSALRLFNVLAHTNPPEAIRAGEQWLKTNPKDQRMRRALADAHARAANWPAARAGYEALLQLNPRDAEAANNLANVLFAQKDPSAQKIAEQALALQPNAPHIISTAGWAAHLAGQPDRALQLLRDARLRDPENAETRFYLGAVLAASGRSAEAKSELEAALSSREKFTSAAEAERILRTLK